MGRAVFMTNITTQRFVGHGSKSHGVSAKESDWRARMRIVSAAKLLVNEPYRQVRALQSDLAL